MIEPVKKFHKVNIEISNICNLQCSFCPEVIRPKQIMSIELFEKIIRSVAPLTDQVCLHLMGDPLVHPHLEQFIKICSQINVRIFFVTNGVLLRTTNSEALLDPILRQVNFSLHSFADNYGDRDPSLYLEKIFKWTELAFVRRPDLYINYRLWNLSDPKDLKAKQNLIVLKKIEQRFEFVSPMDIDVRKQKSVRIKNRLYLHFDSEFIWPDLALPLLGTHGRCHGLSSHFGILVDGTVVPCCLDKEGSIPLGNIQTLDLQEILNSPRALSILNGFKNQRLVESLCQRCQYIERFQ